jgi:hypothetical protein
VAWARIVGIILVARRGPDADLTWRALTRRSPGGIFRVTGNTDGDVIVFNPASPIRVFNGICYRGAS